MKITRHFLLNLVLMVAVLGLYSIPVQASPLNAPTAMDVIATVNSLRASNGLPPLRTNSALMTAAQAQSDYQASIGTWSHAGPDGSSPTQRDIAAGYGNAISTSENVAELNSNLPVDTLINTVWSDSIHMATMLSKSATDMGAGVTVKDGYAYYTLDVSYLTGRPAKISSPFPTPIPVVIATSATTSSPDNVPPVQTVTPQAVGIMVHVVQPGDSLYSIAMTYETTISDIRSRNGIAQNNDVIYPGEKLLIRVAFTPTASPAPTGTDVPSTSTPAPTGTLELQSPTPAPSRTLPISPSLSPSLTPSPQQTAPASNDSNSPPPIAMIMLIIGGLGLAGVIAFFLLRKNNP